MLTGYETENAYSIFEANSLTQEPTKKILLGLEKSNLFIRNMMSENMRSFEMDIQDV